MEAYSGFASVYDRLMRDVDYDKWAAYIASFLPKNCSVLECACGTGAISVRLKRMGFNITASDISLEMLQTAAENARRSGQKLQFLSMDMRHIEFHKRVDAIVCACDGVNYLTDESDLADFLSSANRALKTGGRLLFDVSTLHKLKNVLGCSTFASDEGSAAYIWENMFDGVSRLCRMRLTLFEKAADGLYKKSFEEHIQYGYTASELSESLLKFGFIPMGIYDAFTENTPDNNCERLQIVAEKVSEING